MNAILRLLAGRTTSETAQELLAADATLTRSVAQNPALSPRMWKQLWDRKPKVELAVELVSRPLDENSIDAVLKREKRITVIEALVKKCRLSDEQAMSLLESPLMSTSVAASWYDSGLVPESASFALAYRAGAERATRYAMKHTELTYEQVSELIGKNTSWVAPQLTRFVDCRPDLLDAMLSDTKMSIRTAALCSRHLFDQEKILTAVTTADRASAWSWSEMILAVAMQPNVQPETLQRLLEHIEALKTSDDSVRYSCTRAVTAIEQRLRDNPFGISRPWESVDTAEEIALLEKLTFPNRERASIMLRALGRVHSVTSSKQPATAAPSRVWTEEELLALPVGQNPPIGSAAALVALLDARFASMGRPGWETGIGLLSSSFQGTVGDLLEVSQALLV